MRTAPADLDTRDVVAAVAGGWPVRAVAAEYVAVGGGSHHWSVLDDAGRPHWATVDELDAKGFLGATRGSALDGLRSAFDTAVALREASLDFIVAPVPAAGGESVRRLGARHAIAVFPFVKGRSGQFGDALTAGRRTELVDMLVRLHAATPRVTAIARRASPQLSGRAALEDAIGSVDRAWEGGPLSKPARALLARYADAVRRLLETFDHLAGQVAAAGGEPVVTHGEPHPGNLVSAGGRLLLVDWDTVALAPPERDLWMLDTGDGAALARYAEASGRQVDPAAVRLYRLRWRLDDIASFADRLRSAHERTADTEHALRALAHSLELDAQPWAREVSALRAPS